MAKPGTYQHQRRISVRKRTDYPRPAPDLPVHPLNYIVCTDLGPMLGRKVTVGQSFLNSSFYFLCSLRQLHGFQLGKHCGGLLPRCLLALLGVDRLEHLSHTFHLGLGDHREYIPVEMNHTALVLGLRKYLSHGFLREVGLPIHSIGELLAGEDSGAAVVALLEQQKTLLQEELQERQKKLELVEQLQQELKGVERVSVESICDIAYRMKNQGKLKRLHATMLATGIPLCMVQWAGIALWIVSGQWWLLALHLAAVLPYAVWVTRRYFTQTAYICPQCHEVFKPEFGEAFWARHTATLRKLTCTCCGFRGFCVETMEQTPE